MLSYEVGAWALQEDEVQVVNLAGIVVAVAEVLGITKTKVRDGTRSTAS
jgi:hypothetical protein